MVPDDEPNPVQCVVHDVFTDAVLQIDEAEAARVLGNDTGIVEEPEHVAGDGRLEMDALPSTSREAAYSSESFPGSATPSEPAYLPGEKEFLDCYDAINKMLKEDLGTATGMRDDTSQCSTSSPPSLIEDLSDSNDSKDSDLEIPPPAPLSISRDPDEPEARPLPLAIRPQQPSPPSTTSREPTNPVHDFISKNSAPTLASPILSTHFTTKPKKRVHFHPSTTTSHYWPGSYTPEFLDSTFTPLPSTSYEPVLATRRRRRKLEFHIKELLGVPITREAKRLRAFPKTCVKSFLEAQHTDSPQPCAEHVSLGTQYENMNRRLDILEANFVKSISLRSTDARTASSEVSNLSTYGLLIRQAKTLKAAKKALSNIHGDMEDFMEKSGYLHDERRMAACADTCDVEVFERAVRIFGQRLGELSLDFWTGEREEKGKQVEALLLGGGEQAGNEE